MGAQGTGLLREVSWPGLLEEAPGSGAGGSAPCSLPLALTGATERTDTLLRYLSLGNEMGGGGVGGLLWAMEGRPSRGEGLCGCTTMPG